MPPDASSPSKPDSNQMQSPYKDLKRAIINVISQLQQRMHFKIPKQKEKRAQAKPAEVLTSEEVAARLKVEEEEKKKEASQTQS